MVTFQTSCFGNLIQSSMILAKNEYLKVVTLPILDLVWIISSCIFTFIVFKCIPTVPIMFHVTLSKVK